jgi:hypothetical protein
MIPMHNLIHRAAATFAVFCAILCSFAADASASFNATLEGQSATAPNSHTPTGVYISTNLQNWSELDTIPFRVNMTGGPVTNKTITVHFRPSEIPGVLLSTRVFKIWSDLPLRLESPLHPARL